MIKQILFVNYVRIAAVVCFYWITSILTVFINKALLSSKDVDLDAPFFIIWYQCFVSVIISIVIKVLSKNSITTQGSPLNKEVFKSVIGLTILFASMISFNNLCLKYVDVSFYYIGRSLTTVFNVILTFLVLKEKVSFKVLICCAIITIGFWGGINQESESGTLSYLGVVFGILASLFVALFTIYTRKVLPTVGDNAWLLTYYNNFYSCFLVLPFVLITNDLNNLLNYDHLYTTKFWSMLTLSGICGYLIGYASSLQIKVTSPLTHNISGTAKACAQTIVAVYWYDEGKSWIWWMSNWVVLFGSAAYTSVRQREFKEKLEKSRAVFA